MLEGIIFALILVVAIPVGFLMSTAVVSAIIGALMTMNAERANPDSELLETNY